MIVAMRKTRKKNDTKQAGGRHMEVPPEVGKPREF
jgi:hypothetical protein